MKTIVNWESGLRMTATMPEGLTTVFDAFEEGGPPKTAPSPVEHVLAAIAACSAVDVLAILTKRRRTVSAFSVEAEGQRREDHPRVLISVKLLYVVTSPDANMTELDRAVQLSMEKYCSVSAMVKAAGCAFAWESIIKRPAPSD